MGVASALVWWPTTKADFNVQLIDQSLARNFWQYHALTVQLRRGIGLTGIRNVHCCHLTFSK